MTSISHSLRYLPHDLNTKYYSVKLYRQTKSIKHVCRRYHVSKASLMHWNSLLAKSVLLHDVLLGNNFDKIGQGHTLPACHSSK